VANEEISYTLKLFQLFGRAYGYFFITPVYLHSVQNTISKWEETETKGEEQSSVALIWIFEAMLNQKSDITLGSDGRCNVSEITAIGNFGR
jgi:hypothetical protein